jgi:hypothetical protein
MGNPFVLGRDGDRRPSSQVPRRPPARPARPARASQGAARKGAGILVRAAGMPCGRAHPRAGAACDVEPGPWTSVGDCTLQPARERDPAGRRLNLAARTDSASAQALCVHAVGWSSGGRFALISSVSGPRSRASCSRPSVDAGRARRRRWGGPRFRLVDALGVPLGVGSFELGALGQQALGQRVLGLGQVVQVVHRPLEQDVSQGDPAEAA